MNNGRPNKDLPLARFLVVAAVILIAAATIGPWMTQASPEAKISRLVERLQMIRARIDLYRVEHSDQLPGAGPVTFEQALTRRTNAAGEIDCTGPYGPYLNEVLENPFNRLSTVQVEAGSRGLGDGDHGWHFNLATGTFHPDTDFHKDL